MTDRGNLVRQRSWDLLKNRSFSRDRKTLLLVGTTTVAFDYHESMFLLIEAGHPTSAFALIRNLFDIIVRSLYVFSHFSEEQVEKYLEDSKFDLPGMKVMCEAIDARFGLDGAFETLRQRTWKTMNSFSHGGGLQLSRQFKSDEIAPDFTDGEIAEVLNAATSFLMLIVRPLLVQGKLDKEVEAFEKIWKEYFKVV